MVRRRFFILTAILLLAINGLASAAEVKGLRMWPAPDNTRLVFDLDGPVEHTLFSLSGPHRLVIDLKNSRLNAVLPTVSYNNRLKNIRHGRQSGGTLRVVLDLSHAVRPKSFVLKPHGEYGHRLVVDLYDADDAPAPPVIKSTPARADKLRDLVVAIDAGHGGDDPGAVGPRGTREKDVVLAIAKRLEKMINREPGMKAVLVRTGDYYIGLSERVNKARKAQADLFVSIHADAYHDRRARGSSVFVRTERRASSDVARFLADSENSADLVGGVSLDDKTDDLLKLVLVDMVKNTTIEHSHELAENVLSGLKKVNRLHKNDVEQARFMVLRAPDVPSILVETAFISNPEEEKKLRSPAHQDALASAILRGAKAYFNSNPMPGTLLAERQPPRKHRISRGDTLSEIADRYQVSVSMLRDVNNLNSDMLRVGQVLHIPSS